eukprot:TRINITY_DN7070_c0_g1_i14.p1 TRINITY_DN7070_c0_g1~~TRINITY_DN7070_c0_g1_i14.p1  ORF type:complete len:226 (-),score=15.01 TRINITY_DN7070_c0_g1_i14:71-748(-)
MIIKKRFLVSFVIGITLCVSSLAKPLERIEHSRSQSDTIRDILAKLQTRHYREMRIDDQLSVRYLDNYLDTLDPSRMFFYDKDIRSFEQHRLKFDDYFKTGNLSPAFEIYHLYRQRVVSRLKSVLELLTDPTVKFDFTVDEEVLLERDEEPWPKSLAAADKLWHKQLMKKVYRKLLQCFQQVGIVPVDHDLWIVGAQFLGGVAVDVFVFARMLLVVVVVCMVGLQ